MDLTSSNYKKPTRTGHNASNITEEWSARRDIARYIQARTNARGLIDPTPGTKLFKAIEGAGPEEYAKELAYLEHRIHERRKVVETYGVIRLDSPGY